MNAVSENKHARIRPVQVGERIFVEYILRGVHVVERPAVVTEVYGRAIRVDFSDDRFGNGTWFAKCQIKPRKVGQ